MSAGHFLNIANFRSHKTEGYVYYIPREGEDMTNAFCVAPALRQMAVVKGEADAPVRNIRFENLSFQYASYIMPRMGVDPMQAAAGEEAAIMLDFSENVSMIDCEVLHTGAYGIWLRQECHDNRIEHCYLADRGAGGIKVGEPYWRTNTRNVTSGNVVHNNIITYAGAVLPCGVGVALFHTSDNEVTHNEISDLRYSGVSIGWVWGYNNSSSIWTTAMNDNNAMDYNLYWHLSGTPSFAGHSWNEWRKMKEPHSLLANPHFRDARNGDFRFVSLKAAKKIGFKPLDTSSVGIYGSEEWKSKASLPQSVLDEYERGVRNRRNK